MFVPIQHTVKSVLEIGVHKGESLRLWRDFFPNATVYGIDTNDLTFLNTEKRIVTISKTDAYTQTIINILSKVEPEGFDIIIDDGPHTIETQRFFLEHYSKLLKKGGILVLEDIIYTEWTTNLMTLLNPWLGKTTMLDMFNQIKTEKFKLACKNGLNVIIYEKF